MFLLFRIVITFIVTFNLFAGCLFPFPQKKVPLPYQSILIHYGKGNFFYYCAGSASQGRTAHGREYCRASWWCTVRLAGISGRDDCGGRYASRGGHGWDGAESNVPQCAGAGHCTAAELAGGERECWRATLAGVVDEVERGLYKERHEPNGD